MGGELGYARVLRMNELGEKRPVGRSRCRWLALDVSSGVHGLKVEGDYRVEVGNGV